MSESFYTVKWDNNTVKFIDQKKLPNKEIYVTCSTYNEVAEVIKTMVVRGAPAIGVSAAYGIALGLINTNINEKDSLIKYFDEVCEIMSQTRPTAVNLFWAIDRMKKLFNTCIKEDKTIEEIKSLVKAKADEIHGEDIDICKKIGIHGHKVIADGDNILTHCNAGALATAGYGTALGVIRAAFENGKKIHVYADETRPFLQGARLTMWELMKDEIDCTLISDNMSGHMMSNGKVNVIIVGADRIAANGDAANKIGTYSLAVMAKYHNIPMYIAAPVSTIDFKCSHGSKIPIEQRSEEEVKMLNGIYITPENAKAAHPAFDVTPNELISGIITEKGILTAPYDTAISKLQDGEL
jgi:methylthioribose-1-phosphate isomerase